MLTSSYGDILMLLKYGSLTSVLLIAGCSVPQVNRNLGSSQHATIDQGRPSVFFGHYFPSGSERNLTDQEAATFRGILKDAKEKNAPPREHSPHPELCFLHLDGRNYYFLRSGETVTFDLPPSHQARFTGAVAELVKAP